ncbi:MAG: DUF4124 domain-containing protein [Pseudomonadota bacterium]
MPLIIKGPDGRPIMTLDDWKPAMPASVDEFAKQLLTKGKQVLPSSPEAVYRWQDENGAWHFADEAPPGSDVQLVEISEANRMQAPVMPPKPSAAASETSVAPFSQIPGMTVSPQQLKETMENLDQLQDKVEKRRLLLDESL